MKTRIDWSGRAIDYTDDELRAILDAAKTANPQTQGRHLKEFEEALRGYFGVEHAYACANATNALDLIALLSGLRAGDEVILPAHTFCATAIPFGRIGARLIWADIDPRTFLVNPDDIRKKLSPRTKAVIVVHLYGMPCEMDGIAELCHARGLTLIEDCAQSFGAEYRGRKTGVFGDFAVFSLHGQKNITTLGEGGVLLVKDDSLGRKVPGLRHNGLRPFEGPREFYWKPAMSNVDVDLEGVWPYNFCMTEVQAALGAKLLQRVDSLNQRRRDRAAQFRSAMRDFSELQFQFCPTDIKHAYHLLAARYDGRQYGVCNDDLIQLLFTRFGIKCVVQYCPLYRYPLFQKMGFGAADCPESDAFFDRMISFPFHVWMSDEDFSYLIRSVTEALILLRKK